MSFTSHIQKKLKDYIQCEDPSAAELLKNELSQELPNPHFVTDCPFIPTEHILKKEAWIVSDAFEAVTNGMFSPELSQELQTIPSHSLFYPWVLLTQAVKAFYAGRFNQLSALIALVPEGSAPAFFKGFFTAIAGSEAVPPEWENMKSSVLDDKRELTSSLEQLIEAASAGMEDLLLETAGMIIGDLIREHPDTAAKIIIWCFHQLQEIDILPDKAADKARQLFGEAEGLRLTALATLSYDQDRSLIYWLLTLEAYLNNQTTREEVKAYLSIIHDVSETVALEFELTDEYLSLLMTHTASLVSSLNHLYPDMTEEISREERTTPSFTMQVLRKLAGDKEKGQAPSHKKTIQNSTAPVQLELFSF